MTPREERILSIINIILAMGAIHVVKKVTSLENADLKMVSLILFRINRRF
jgi:hypothetical protein